MKYSLVKKYAALCCISLFVCFLASCPNGTQDTDNNVTLTVNVLDSLGGTLLSEQTNLTVSETSTASSPYAFVQVSKGTVQLLVQKNRCYNLYLAGQEDKRAASVIENYRIGDTKEQTVTMIQRTIQRKAAPIAPSVESVTLNDEPFTDGALWESPPYKDMKLKIVFRSPSRPILTANDGNFGCAVAVGSSASAYNNIATVSPECERTTDGSWRCTAQFTFNEISFPNEINDFVITAYDMAGNRVERYINSVTFKECRAGLNMINNAQIKGFRVEMRRFPHSLKLFNEPERQGLRSFERAAHNDASATYEVLLWFYIKDYASQDLYIRWFDIYRRKQGESEWVKTGRKLYTKDYNGAQNLPPSYHAYTGSHLGYDTAPSLEENVTYEYRIKAFTDSTHYVDSPIATARLLPANSIELTFPADNGFVKKSELNDLSFSFRLTNPDIWETPHADFFTFGLLVADKASPENIVFAGTVSVDLKKPEGERLALKFASSNQFIEYTLAELKNMHYIESSITEDDLISYRNGIVTLKPKYLQTQGFCHPKYQKNRFQTGYTYCWDILDWGENPVDTADDEPAVFTALWECKSKDGEILPPPTEKLSTSESFANDIRYAGSLNGQCYFKVTDE